MALCYFIAKAAANFLRATKIIFLLQYDMTNYYMKTTKTKEFGFCNKANIV